MDTAEKVYEQRRNVNLAEQQRYAERSRFISYGRMSTFLGGAACVIATIVWPSLTAATLYAVAGLLFVSFFLLVAYHAGVDRRERRHDALRAINEIAIAKLRREWARVPTSADAAPPLHPYAEDLDLFGRASLFSLVWSGGTEMARTRLIEWLLQPADPATVRARQEAVAELAPLVDLRQDLLASARAGALESHDVLRFLQWAEGPPWLSAHVAAVWSIRALTLATLGLIALQASGIVGEAYWIVPVVASFIVSNLFAAKNTRVFERAFAHHAVFRYYAELLHLMRAREYRSPLLRQLHRGLVVGHLAADRQIARLNRLMQLADLRHSALLHAPVQVLTLWDFHVVLAVERWQRQVGHAVRGWFDALATFEALASLAALHFENPAWVFAQIDETGGRALDASGLGHPLLPASSRVDNDVCVGPAGTFLLVTGSNMSGKSTLLRAIGVNVVLAQAGAPACATSLRMPAVRLYTSMRVQDSLEEGVSFFMAAVKRLKQIVEAVRPSAGEPPWPLLYLLDEVLQGTNTAERQIAARSILRHLLVEPAIGAVTTHDLTLAATPDLAAAASAVHFTEHFEARPGGTTMTFDYRLRPGIATSRNALKLMQLVGLSVPNEEEE